MQLLDLDLDKENELIFKLSVMGTKPATTKSRFLLEYNDFSFSFPAKNLPDGEVSVLIPPLENMISEGRYGGSLEVIIDDKVVFTPISVTTDFKKSINIVAEVVTNRRTETKVTASHVVSVNKSPVSTESESKQINSSINKSKNSGSPISEKAVHAELPPAAESPNKNINESRDENKNNAKHMSKRSRPPQRNRKRPRQTAATSKTRSNRLIETKIKGIAKSKDVSITQDQMKKIVNLLKNRGDKK